MTLDSNVNLGWRISTERGLKVLLVNVSIPVIYSVTILENLRLEHMFVGVRCFESN